MITSAASWTGNYWRSGGLSANERANKNEEGEALAQAVGDELAVDVSRSVGDCVGVGLGVTLAMDWRLLDLVAHRRRSPPMAVLLLPVPLPTLQFFCRFPLTIQNWLNNQFRPCFRRGDHICSKRPVNSADALATV